MAITLETNGVSMSWKNLRVKIDVKTQHIFRSTTHTVKELIHNVNGFVEPNSLVAIMGASGSGKSTLMTVLANRQSGDFKVNGEIRLNGQKIPSGAMKKISGFVYQDDLFVPTLTVSEHLHFAARMKLDRRITTEHRRALVNKILKDVGLTECANRFIGNSSEEEEKLNLSGGEQKRLSVATELLINPALLFCDEPTTGLDSFAALKLITIMKNMANDRGKTIICSIHQPSEQIFDLFHQIILLHDGKIVFSGTTENALEFFQSIGYLYKQKQNPADYLIKSLSMSTERGLESFSFNNAGNICLKYEASQYAKYVNKRIEQQRYRKEELRGLEYNINPISWFHKFYLITYREGLSTIRDPLILCFDLIRLMVFAVILGTCMKKTLIMNQESIQSIKGVLFAVLNENFFTPIYFSIGHFLRKMPIFIRERSNNMNTSLMFYLSNIFSLFPGLLLHPVVFTVTFYALFAQQYSWIVLLLTITINVLIFNVSASFGILVSLATNDFTIADTVVQIVRTFFNPLSGMMSSIKSIPAIFSWMRYISWVTYSFEALLIVYFENVECIQCSKTSGSPCLKNGPEVLNWMGFDRENLQRNMIIMFFMYIVFLLLGFIALRIRLYLKLNG
ncbi:protein scarlet-like [Planococcus citri]|uniref:protein scarlet-like n=1 Tax=Planococcus citri TaxID=170843 RepID=UPI0031F7521F